MGLLFSGLIYNLAEGLLPDKNFKFDIISQNILAYTIGLIVAFHYLFYVKTEYKITFPIKISYSMIGIITLLILILLFILPYTITKSLSYSRIFFIGFFLMTLALASIIVISRQIVKLASARPQVINTLLQSNYGIIPTIKYRVKAKYTLPGDKAGSEKQIDYEFK